MVTLMVVALLGFGEGEDRRFWCVAGQQQAETSIRVDPNDPKHFVAACRNDVNSATQIETFASFDGGLTASCGTIPPEPGYAYTADPIVVFDTVGGVHLFVVDAQGPAGGATFVYHSTDGGVTFPSRTLVDLYSTTTDKPQASTCFLPGSRYGDIACTWTREDFINNKWSVMVAVSHDQCQTWSIKTRVSGRNSFGHLRSRYSDVAWGPAGDLNAIWTDFETLEVLFSRSTDGGVTWGTPTVVANYVECPIPLPGYNFHAGPVFALDVDTTSGPYSGRLYVAYFTWDTTATPNADVYCASSGDQGQTWNSVLVNVGDPWSTDQIFPEVSVDPQGAVNAIWLDRRSDPTGKSFEMWSGRSLDGGATFVEGVLSDVPFDPSLKSSTGTFIGDYNSIDARETLAYVAWGDCRPGSDGLDLWIDPWVTGLTASTRSISAATGGSCDLSIDPGPNLGGAIYLVLGSLSGINPGFDLDGVHVPLVVDAFTLATIAFRNGANLSNSFGVLAADGSSVMHFDTLGPFDPSLAGYRMNFAALVFDAGGRLVHAAGPEWVDLVP